MSSRRSSEGFTLLEVLAAVAILGIWYVILAGFAMQGMRAQGESHRRLEASFLADEAISGIEAGLTRGEAPEEDSQEIERDEYIVKVEVTSYALDVPPPADLPVARDSIFDEVLDVGGVDLLAGATLSGPAPLRSVRVEVSWMEGYEEKKVVRDTFAFDLRQVESELAELESSIAETAREELTTDDPEDATTDSGDARGADNGGLRELGDALRQGTSQ